MQKPGWGWGRGGALRGRGGAGVLTGAMRVQLQPSWKVAVGWQGRRGLGAAGRQVAVVVCVHAGAVGGSEDGGGLHYTQALSGSLRGSSGPLLGLQRGVPLGPVTEAPPTCGVTRT